MSHRPIDSQRRKVLRSAGALALSACTATLVAPRAQARAKLQASVYIGTTPHFGSVIVGAEKGFFEAAGLDVSLTKFANGAVAADAFRVNDQTIVVSGDLATVRMWQSGAYAGVCSVANYTKLSVVIARKGLNNAADLKGKKVGVMLGSTSEYFARLFFSKAGMTLEQMDVVNLQPAEMVAALVRSDIDAAVLWQPFGWRAEQASSGRIQTISDASGYFRERIIASTSRSYAAKHSEEVGAFVRGLAEASRWCTQNREQAAQIVARNLNISDTSLASRMMGVIDWSPATTPELEADVRKIAAFLKAPVDWNQQFDSRFTRDLPKSSA